MPFYHSEDRDKMINIFRRTHGAISWRLVQKYNEKYAANSL
jgi:hypothetical protein